MTDIKPTGTGISGDEGNGNIDRSPNSLIMIVNVGFGCQEIQWLKQGHLNSLSFLFTALFFSITVSLK